jgi:Sec-independent protein translocase protein TatA
MFGLSFTHLLILGLVALLFLKPADFLRLARNAGLWSVTLRHNLLGLWHGLEE